MLNVTLCYIERGGQYLMLHRTKKKQDVNAGKWIGVGGKFEADESPDECLVREVKEETGLTLTRWRCRGLVTFVAEGEQTEYMHLFTADGFEGRLGECSEGELAWVDIDQVPQLPLWPGDRIFLRLLCQGAPFFLLKLCYDAEGRLVRAVLDGREVDVG